MNVSEILLSNSLFVLKIIKTANSIFYSIKKYRIVWNLNINVLNYNYKWKIVHLENNTNKK